MSLTHPKSFSLGAVLLVVSLSGGFPALSIPPFSAHMLAHMLVVAVAAPLLAIGVAGGPWDPVKRRPQMFSALLASMLEFVAVWMWHTPSLHHAARLHLGYWIAEQLTFLGAGLFLWLAAWGGDASLRRQRSAAGITGLLLTSMHMTLLGALIALSKRTLYDHGAAHSAHAPSQMQEHVRPLGIGANAAHLHEIGAPLMDQQMGGVIMIFLGASSYLVGGVLLGRAALAGRFSKTARAHGTPPAASLRSPQKGRTGVLGGAP